MNAFEQLEKIRAELEERQAGPETMRLLDRAVSLAEPEKENPLSISMSMMLRHLLKMPESVNNHYIYMDLLGLQGDIEEEREFRRDDRLPDATVDPDRQIQHDHNYYKKLKQKQNN